MTKPTRGDRPQIRVYLPSDYVDQLDREVSLGRFPNRSEAVAYAVRRAYLDPDLDTSSYLESIERDLSFVMLAVLISGRDRLSGDALSVLNASAKNLAERGHLRPLNHLESGAVRTLLASGKGG